MFFCIFKLQLLILVGKWVFVGRPKYQNQPLEDQPGEAEMTLETAKVQTRRVWSDLKLKSWISLKWFEKVDLLTHFPQVSWFFGMVDFFEWRSIVGWGEYLLNTKNLIIALGHWSMSCWRHQTHRTPGHSKHTWQVDDLMNVIGYFFNLRNLERKEARKIVKYRVSIQLAGWLDWLIINQWRTGAFGLWEFVFPIIFTPFRFHFWSLYTPTCLGAVRHLLLDSTFGFEVLLEREEHRRALQAANCSGHPERMDQGDGTKRVDSMQLPFRTEQHIPNNGAIYNFPSLYFWTEMTFFYHLIWNVWTAQITQQHFSWVWNWQLLLFFSCRDVGGAAVLYREVQGMKTDRVDPEAMMTSVGSSSFFKNARSPWL